MTDFGVSATLEINVDSKSLAEAQAEVEDALNVPLKLGTTGSIGSVPMQPDGGAGLAGGAAVSQLEAIKDLNEEQVDLLEDIEETGLGGGGNGLVPNLPGGGGGIDPLDVLGLSKLFDLGSGGGGGGKGKGGGRGGLFRRFSSFLARGGAATAITLPQFGARNVDGSGQAFSDGPIEQLIGEAVATTLGGAGDALAGLGGGPSVGTGQAREALQQRVQSGDLSPERAQEIASQAGLGELTLKPSQETRNVAATLSDIDIPEPGWLSDLVIDEPGWLSNLQNTPVDKDSATGRFAVGDMANNALEQQFARPSPFLTASRGSGTGPPASDVQRGTAQTGNGSGSGNRARQRRTEQTQVQADVTNNIEASFELRERELERFFRNPERYIEEVVTNAAGGRR